MSRGRPACVMLAVLASAMFATAAAAAPRWGVEVGPQFDSFVTDPPVSPLSSSYSNTDHGLTGWGGGVRAEWGLTHAWATGVALRYEERGAGRRSAVAQFFNGSNVQELVAEEDFRLRYLSFAPELRAGPFAGFSAHVAPELAYLLEARRHVELSETAPHPAFGPAPTGTIFESLYGRPLDEDVTSDYQRLQQGLTLGVGWEHALGRHLARLTADYHRMTSEPRRTPGPEDRMQEWRGGLTVLF